MANHLVNGGFETGAMSPWQKSSAGTFTILSSGQRSGNYCLQSKGITTSFKQTVTGLSAGTVYTFTLWTNSKYAGGYTRFTLLGNASGGMPDFTVQPNEVGVYVKRTGTFTVTSNRIIIMITSTTGSGSNNNTTLWDDFSIV